MLCDVVILLHRQPTRQIDEYFHRYSFGFTQKPIVKWQNLQGSLIFLLLAKISLWQDKTGNFVRIF